MDIDVDQYLGAVDREVQIGAKDGKETRIVFARRTYATTREDLWDALTNPERIPRWFLPVEGDLQLGGHFQFKGNAGGDILACEEPEHVGVTWAMGEGISWVDVTLSTQSGGSTLLTLRHETPLDEHFWDQYGPGAVGVGWELGLMGLAEHLRTGEPMDHEQAHTFHTTNNGRRFITGSSESWADASIAAGTDGKAARSAQQNTTAFYLGEAAEDR